MDRIKVIQSIVDKIKARMYLEIGVEFGTTFFYIKANRKIAVDPEFKISLKKKLFYLPDRLRSKYFEMTSDDFFAKHHNLFLKHKIDVAFIDGMHTYRQSLKDVENCLKYLGDNGVIVMHDCNPQCEASASPNRKDVKNSNEAKGKWNGDVWRTIANLRSARSDLRVFVLDCDHGLGIIKKGEPENMLDHSADYIEKMTYQDLASQREKILNLKSVNYFEEFLKSL